MITDRVGLLNRWTRVLWVCMLCGLGASCSPKSSPDTHPDGVDAEIVSSLRTHMEELSNEGRFSGVVLLAKDGVPLFEQAYGKAHRGLDVDNDVETKFNLASVGKMFTAVAIMQLIEQNKLSLNDRLIDVLPDYPNSEAASKITIAHLLAHQSGLGGVEELDLVLKTHQELIPLFASRPLLFEPGTRNAYSNAGFVVLGVVIERLSNQTYFDYIQEHVFLPAGMNDTGYFSAFDDVSNMAIGYTHQGFLGRPPLSPDASPRPFPAVRRGTSAGGSISTVRDMLRFGEAIRNNQLLRKESVELILSGAHGMVSGVANGVRYMGHGGGTQGGSTYVEMYPDTGYATVTLSNFDEGAPLVYERLRQEITGGVLPKAIALSTEELKRFEGRYQTESPAHWVGVIDHDAPTEPKPVVVTAEGGGLWIDLGGGAKRRFLPLSPVEFFDRDTMGPARFIVTVHRFDASGRACATPKVEHQSEARRC